MRKCGTQIAVLVAGIALGWLLGRVSDAPEPGLGAAPPAPTAPTAAPATDPAVATWKSEVDRLRDEVAHLEGELATARGAAQDESGGPVEFAEETGDPANGRIRVEVTDAEGQPVADRTVRVWRIENGAVVDNQDALTGVTGSAEFPPLAPGTWHVLLVHPNGMTTIEATVLGGRVTLVRLPSREGCVVRGIVRDLEKGPLAGVRVNLRREEGPVRTYLSTMTTERGSYRFEHIPSGSWVVFLEGGGLAYDRRHSETVHVPRGGSEVVRDFLTGDAGLSGRIMDAETGAPISGAKIMIQRGGPLRSATSDDNGIYRIADLGPGTYSLAVSKDGYGIESPQDVAVPVGGQELDIQLKPAATLVLTIYGPEGKPYTGRLFLAIRCLDPEAGGIGTTVTADADGRATYRQILPGEYRFELKALMGIGEGTAEATIAPGENNVMVRLVKL